MTDRHDDDTCLFSCANASRAQTMLASAAIARAADAWCQAQGLRPRRPRLELVARVGTLRNGDLVAALADHGLCVERARALAPRIARKLADEALRALDPDTWLTFNDAYGVPATERRILLQLATLAIEVAADLQMPMPVPHARVTVEPLDRCPEGPWPGLLATHDPWLATPGLHSCGLLAEVRDRLVANRPGVRAWPPASRADESTITVRTPEGRPLILVPFVVTNRATHAELEATILPDATLPGLVHLPSARECV